MSSSAIKYPKRLFSQTGGDASLPARVITLENNEYKITYFAEISSSTGTITIPTGATILLDQFQGGVDAYVCTIQNGQPTGNFPQTSLGVTVDVASFNALGNFTLSGTPSSYPVALIYILKIKAKDYSNLDITKILDLEDINAVSRAGDTMSGSLSSTQLITTSTFTGNEPNSTATNRGYTLNTRNVAVTFPVPTIQPTTNNSVIAFDIMPKGTPVENGNGFAWVDVCTTDIKDNNNPSNSARIGATSTKIVFGSRFFNGASARALSLEMQTGVSTVVDAIYIDNTGKKVGFNTTTPNYNLQIHQDATATATSIQITNGSSGSANTDGLNIGIDNQATPNAYVLQRENAELQFWTNVTKRSYITGSGSFVLANAALATNATAGFTYIPTCAGIPTGVPTSITGVVPMVYDTTNNNFYIYNSGWKKTTVFS